MHPIDDKNEFQAVDPENGSRAGQFSRESPDEEMDEELSDEELAAEVEELNRAEGVPEFLDDEEAEKIPDLRRPRRLARIASCVWGTFLGAAIAGMLVNDQPRPRQVRAFFIFFPVLALLLSCVWHWFFVVRPGNVEKKMKDEQERPPGSEPIHPR